jgi:hypothetical protein
MEAREVILMLHLLDIQTAKLSGYLFEVFGWIQDLMRTLKE